MSGTGKIIDADVLIIGSGLAGLLAALKLAERGDTSVVLVSKGALLDSNSSYAQGGVAAVIDGSPFDSPQAHLYDTLKSGAGLTNEVAAHSIIYSGDRLIRQLDEFGIAFDRGAAGELSLALEGGHSKARVLHNKDATGRAITTVLSDLLRHAAARDSKITILEHTCASDLLVVDGKCIGARLVGFMGEQCVMASHTVLATGGVGQVFERTTNPSVATGDGIALAYRAGARLADMEFVQFHPTALRKDNAPAFLISEAVRGAGATLIDHSGRRFVERFHQDGELATRDVVARAIHTVMREHGLSQVYLDLRPIGAATIAARFPNIVKTCAQYGVDALSQPIPVAPAAHYMMGGIEATAAGRTNVDGLYAIGECACTGLHGANRLASNSLLEAGVMALNLAGELNRNPQHLTKAARRAAFVAAIQPQILTLPADLTQFKRRMYQNAGLVRSGIGLSMILQESAETTTDAVSPENCSASNILQVGKLIALAALARRESRGAHLREEYPRVDGVNYYRRFWLDQNTCGWNKVPESAQLRAAFGLARA